MSTHAQDGRARFVRARAIALVLAAALAGTWLFWVFRGGLRWTGDTAAIFTTTGDTIGVPHEVTVVQTGRALKESDLRNVIDTALEKVKWLMSPNDPSSEISRFNANDTSEPVRVSPETAEVIAFAMELSSKTAGAFDLSLTPILRALDSGIDPTATELEGMRRHTGMDKLTLGGGTLKKSDPLLALDLHPVVVGYAADLVARGLDRRGVKNYRIVVGDQCRSKGVDSDGAPWSLTLDGPETEGSPHELVLGDSSLGVARTGDRPVIDGRSGRRVAHSLEEVWVLHPDAMRAQAYAHAILTLGPEDGLILAKLLKSPARLALRGAGGELNFQATPDFKARLRATGAKSL